MLTRIDASRGRFLVNWAVNGPDLVNGVGSTFLWGISRLAPFTFPLPPARQVANLLLSTYDGVGVIPQEAGTVP